jgi:hypothetical protein
MHFGTKSYLKSTRNHTVKQTLSNVKSLPRSPRFIFPNLMAREIRAKVNGDFVIL